MAAESPPTDASARCEFVARPEQWRAGGDGDALRLSASAPTQSSWKVYENFSSVVTGSPPFVAGRKRYLRIAFSAASSSP